MPPETNPSLGQPSQGSVTLQDGTQLDPTVVKVMKAIKQAESQGSTDPWNQSGDNGASLGAYQWNNGKALKPGELPINWRNAAQQYLGDPNSAMTPENQNKVAYNQIKAYKDQGLQPEEIAARWNGAYKDQNGQYVYNNPQYGEKFRTALLGDQQPSTDQSATSTPPQTSQAPDTQPKEQGLGEQLGGRAKDLVGAASDTFSGKINPISGLLQVGGAIGGAIGDVVGKGLELIPGVKQLENLLGQGVGALAKTDTGQAVMKSVKEFSDAHPELAADIGAGFNIVTAIPILKGIGAVANVALDAGSIALKDIAEKGVAKSLAEAISKTKTGVRFLADNPTVFKDMVEKRILPDIEGGKYVINDAKATSKNAIKDLNVEVKSALSAPQYADIASGKGEVVYNALKDFPQSKFTYDTMIQNAKELTPRVGQLWDKFEAGQATMQDLNDLRVALDQSVQSVYTKIALPPIKKDLGASLAGALRDFVQTNAPETQNLFADMVKHFRIQDALKQIENKTVKSGMFGGLVKDISTAGGELAGNTVGVPIAGAFTGRGVGGLIERGLSKFSPQSIKMGILNRTTKGAVRQTVKGVVKKVGTAAVANEAKNLTR